MKVGLAPATPCLGWSDICDYSRIISFGLICAYSIMLRVGEIHA